MHNCFIEQWATECKNGKSEKLKKLVHMMHIIKQISAPKNNSFLIESKNSSFKQMWNTEMCFTLYIMYNNFSWQYFLEIHPSYILLCIVYDLWQTFFPIFDACHGKIDLRDRSLFMARGPRRKMIFYGKIFQGLLGVRTKHFAAHSTSRDNFLTPTVGKHNWHNSIGTNLQIMLVSR